MGIDDGDLDGKHCGFFGFAKYRNLRQVPVIGCLRATQPSEGSSAAGR